MSREHRSAVMASFPESAPLPWVINKQPVKEMTTPKWKLSHWDICDPLDKTPVTLKREGWAMKREKRNSQCPVVILPMFTESLALVGWQVVWINRLGPEMFICDEKFLTACISSSRSTDKDSSGCIIQRGHCVCWKSIISSFCPGNFEGLPPSPLSESSS